MSERYEVLREVAERCLRAVHFDFLGEFGVKISEDGMRLTVECEDGRRIGPAGSPRELVGMVERARGCDDAGEKGKPDSADGVRKVSRLGLFKCPSCHCTIKAMVSVELQEER